jgi:hypothetical protein
MILQVLRILSAELEHFLDSFSEETPNQQRVVIGNIAFHDVAKYHPNSNEQSLDDKIVISLVRVEEEASLKNKPHYSPTPDNSSTVYSNPPVFVNLYLLFSFNSLNYENAMTYLSRTVRFFQSKTVFTHKNTQPVNGTLNESEKVDAFKILLDLYSPEFEQINHLWGMLGGKQLPSVMYKIRVLELKLQQKQEVRGVIKQIKISDENLAEL